MVELLVLLLPIISIGTGVYQKLFRTEESAVEFVEYVNKHGIKRQIFRYPIRFLPLGSLILSPLYFPLGWLWMILGIILVISMLAFYFYA